MAGGTAPQQAADPATARTPEAVAGETAAEAAAKATPEGNAQLEHLKDLKARLRGSVPVEIGGNTYRVRAVSLMLFVADTAKLWQLAREDKEALGEWLRNLMASPSYEQMSRVLVRGMVQPQVVAAQSQETERTIWVDTLLIDYQLATELYLAIARQSM